MYGASSVEEWSSILHLADKWKFESIRGLSITQLSPIASPIDKIVIGRRYGIADWLPGAYQAVYIRPDALTLEEGRRLGVDDVIRIHTIRQRYHDHSSSDPPPLHELNNATADSESSITTAQKMDTIGTHSQRPFILGVQYTFLLTSVVSHVP